MQCENAYSCHTNVVHVVVQYFVTHSNLCEQHILQVKKRAHVVIILYCGATVIYTIWKMLKCKMLHTDP